MKKLAIIVSLIGLFSSPFVSLAYTPSTNTYLYWPLSGNSTDSSGNAHDGTDNNVVYDSYGVVCNGSSSDITTAVSSLGNDFTISLKTEYTTGALTSKALAEINVSGYNNYFAYLFTDTGYANANLYDGSNNPYAPGVNQSNDNTEHVLQLVRDNTNAELRLYRDGVLEATALDNTTNPAYSSFHICDRPQGDFFGGKIKDVIIEKRAWTDAQSALYFSSDNPDVIGGGGGGSGSECDSLMSTNGLASSSLACQLDKYTANTLDMFDVMKEKWYFFVLGFTLLIGIWFGARKIISLYT